MALTQQEIDQINQEYQQTQSVLQDIFETSSQIQEQLKAQLLTIKEINKEGQNQFELEDKIREASKQYLKDMQEVRNISDQLRKGTQDEKAALDTIVEGFKAKKTLSGQLTELRKKESELAVQTRLALQGDVNARQEQINLANQIQTAQANIAASQLKVENLSKLINQDQKQLEQTYGREGAQLINQLLVKEQQLETDKNSIQNLKQKLKFAQANNNAFKDALDYAKKQLGITSQTKEQFKEILGINKILATLTLAGLFKAILKMDQATVDFARNLGLSRETTQKITTSFIGAQTRANSLNKNLNASLATIKNQTEATNELNASLGIANVYTEKQLFDQIYLTKQIGLSGAEASNVLKLGLLNQQSAEETTNAVADTVVHLQKQTGVALNFRKVLSEVAQISGQLAAQYKNNPKLLAQAVIQAQLLGLNLEQTAKQADALLNFETSIENELKAELLTGKQLNFERARSLALQGKSAEAAAELMREAGGLEEFQKLNVIQQRALAESVGLTANEMADAAKQQKLLQETGFGTVQQLKEQADSIKDQTARQQFLDQIKQTSSGEQLVAQYEQISLQEKFNGLVETIQSNIVKLAEGPLGNVLHSLSDMLTKAESLKNIFKLIGGIIAFNIGSSIGKIVMTGLPGMIRGAQLFAIRMKRGAYAAALTSAFAGNIAGLIAGAAAFGLAESFIDSKLSGEGGDVGTVPMGGGGVNVNPQTAAATSRANSNQAVLDALNKNNALLEKNLNRSQTVTANLVMNGDTVGKLSTNQSMNSTKNMG